jgi:hypothetical protein
VSADRNVSCSEGWEALRGDALDWLLDDHRPNLHWRVLVELVGRPVDSPAVRRARSGANIGEPVDVLLGELLPDGTWATERALWAPYDGPGWRMVAAVQCGADPDDPRLHAASQLMLETAPGEGGLSRVEGGAVDPVLTARALETMVALGWSGHSRVQEWFAWFQETPDWENRPAVAVGVLKAAGRRHELSRRAVGGMTAVLRDRPEAFARLAHPNLGATDLAELFSVLVDVGIDWRDDWRAALEKLQLLQDDKGRWLARAGEPSHWLTLKATRSLLAYAVPAGLRRLFPAPPKKGSD